MPYWIYELEQKVKTVYGEGTVIGLGNPANLHAQILVRIKTGDKTEEIWFSRAEIDPVRD